MGINPDHARRSRWCLESGEGAKEFWRTVFEVAGGGYDFLAGEIQARQNPALYCPYSGQDILSTFFFVLAGNP